VSEVVLASGNRGKLREIGELLGPLGLVMVSQAALGIGEVAETGETFVENAIIKARHAASASGSPALADDSGLEVDALQGAPGVWSARYAGEGSSDQENVNKLLSALEHIPDAQRRARFHCVLVLMRHGHDPMPLIFHGSWEGSILRAAQGGGGFGYDPVFAVPERPGQSAADLSLGEKGALSHRGKALAELVQALKRSPLA
jgi:XTP/dITP diphosphohydrolase